MEAFIADKKIDVLCLTEHWMKEDEIRAVHLDGFKLVAFSARAQSKAGGTCIFVRETHNVNLLDFNVKYNIEKCIESCSIFLIDFNINLICLYRCPSGHFDTFLASLEGILDSLNNRKQFTIAGDFNIDFLTDSMNLARLRDTMEVYNLNQTI